MNKYRDKSDFEINKAVAIALGAYEVATDIFIDKNRRYEFDKPKSQFFFDPCNNPADAMPIIIENGISMIKSSGGWICCHGAAGVIEHENLYRAAMICFLMIKDAENEK
ncbi:phage protein NinX family protein [Morganella sp. Je.2.23]|uniref:phage protein NinX family protein n=1 Tax=Morganella sp. Je.2.23 TaxID=3142840 RepID=UPI003DA921DC